MAQKEYRELSCRDMGADCDFLVRSPSVDETIRIVSEHACQAHDICEIASVTRDQLKSLARRVWCEGECFSVGKGEVQIPREEWRED